MVLTRGFMEIRNLQPRHDCFGCRRHPRIASGLVVVLAVLTVLARSSPAGATTDAYIYAAQIDTASTSDGVDGYIRDSGIASIPTPDHVAEWIGLDHIPDLQTGTIAGWVQAGQLQGVVGGVGGAAEIKMYGEWAECFVGGIPDYYHIQDFGFPPSSSNYDQAMYIYYDGNQVQYRNCDGSIGTWYEYVWTVGTVYGPVLMRFNMPVQFLYAQAAQEEYYVGSELHIGTDRLGLDPNGLVNDSYGLHRHNGVSHWAVWTAASFPGTYIYYPTTPPGLPDPFVYVTKKLYSAFQVHQ
jgi:hypothetical protein